MFSIDFLLLGQCFVLIFVHAIVGEFLFGIFDKIFGKQFQINVRKKTMFCIMAIRQSFGSLSPLRPLCLIMSLHLYSTLYNEYIWFKKWPLKYDRIIGRFAFDFTKMFADDFSNGRFGDQKCSLLKWFCNKRLNLPYENCRIHRRQNSNMHHRQ